MGSGLLFAKNCNRVPDGMRAPVYCKKSISISGGAGMHAHNSLCFERGWPFVHNCSMEAFQRRMVPANLQRGNGVLQKTARLALRWISYVALAALLIVVIGACFLLLGLLIAAEFDPVVGCPATNTGCQSPVTNEMHCSWIQAANSCGEY